MPLKTASGAGRGRAFAAVGSGSRGVAGPACVGTDFAAVALSMLDFASDFLSGFFAALPFALALPFELAFPLAELALPFELALPALVLAPPLLAVAEDRVPDEELLAEPARDVLALLVLALLVLGLAVLALDVLALAVLDLAVLARDVLALLVLALAPEALLAVVPRLAELPVPDARVPLVLVPEVPVERDPDADRVPLERDVALVAGRLARVVRDAGALLVDDVVAAVAVDIALAASVSDFTADSIALVAVLIDCRAVVIVRADVVALLAAEFSLVAADVTFVAAAETVLGVGVDLVVPRLAAVRLLLDARLLLGRLLVVRLPVVRLPADRLLAVRLLVARPVDDLVPVPELLVAVLLVLGLAELDFAVLPLAVVDPVARLAVAGGTDLSPRS
jgi:hypothetical protein